jgi:hypothetical protein
MLPNALRNDWEIVWLIKLRCLVPGFDDADIW